MRTRSLLVVAVLLFAAACTRDGEAVATGSPTDTGEAPLTSDVPGVQVKGEWIYELYGVKATFVWKTDPATLTVKNGSEQPVGAPDLYVVTRDQRHVDAKVANASPLDPSQSGDYTVTFPDGLVPDDIGLVVLELGGVNWGALSPKIAGG